MVCQKNKPISGVIKSIITYIKKIKTSFLKTHSQPTVTNEFLEINYLNTPNKEATTPKRATPSTSAAAIIIAVWIFPEASG